jgi:hypothetical protein
MNWEEACKILGVSQVSTLDEIKEKYKYKAWLLHRDKTQLLPENIRSKAEEELKSVNQAFNFLSNPLNNPLSNPPRLKIEPMHIRFNELDVGQNKSTTLLVENIGGAYTNIWIDNEPSPWLVVKSIKSITTEQLPLEVTIECTGDGEQGKQYSCDLLVKLENENTHIKDEARVRAELRMKEKLEELSPDVSANPRKNLQPKSGSPKKGTAFSYREFFSTLIVNIIYGSLGLGLLYLLLSESLNAIWWAVFCFYIVFTILFSIWNGLKGGRKTKHNKNPTSPEHSSTNSKPQNH